MSDAGLVLCKKILQNNLLIEFDFVLNILVLSFVKYIS